MHASMQVKSHKGPEELSSKAPRSQTLRVQRRLIANKQIVTSEHRGANMHFSNLIKGKHIRTNTKSEKDKKISRMKQMVSGYNPHSRKSSSSPLTIRQEADDFAY
jgi:hypothetical protein